MASVNNIFIQDISDSGNPQSAFDIGSATKNESILNSAEVANELSDNGKLPDIVAETTTRNCQEVEMEETYLSIAVQVFIPFLIAGFGMVFAGLVLDRIQVGI